MANNRLILRTLNSPWVVPVPDFTKGSVLSHDDVDNNFIYLKGEQFYSVTVSPGVATLNRVNGANLSIPFSGAVNSYTSGTTIIGNSIYFDRNDTLSAYTADLSGMLSGLTLTDGNGTTASGSSADLGGTLYKDAIIAGAGQELELGTAASPLIYHKINSVEGLETYTSPTFPVVTVYTAPGVREIDIVSTATTTSLDINMSSGQYFTKVLNTSSTEYSDFNMQPSNVNINAVSGSTQGSLNLGLTSNDYYFTSGNVTNQLFMSSLDAILSINNSGVGNAYLTLKPNYAEVFSSDKVVFGNPETALSFSGNSAQFIDSRTGTTAVGLEYGADYSANYTPDSLITLRDLDAAITGITSGSSNNTFVTGYTYDNANTFTLFRSNGEPDLTATINTMTGLTVNGTITATTINAVTVSATTVNATVILSGGTNLSNIFATSADTSGLQSQITNNTNNITTLSGQVQTIQGDLISGGTYNSVTDEITLNQNDGGTIVITGATGGGEKYTTGTTLLNNIIYYDRNDTLSAYTTDLTSFTTGLTTTNLATDNLVQDAETRLYDMNSQSLVFENGTFEVTGSTFGDVAHFESGGGELYFGGASGVGTGGSNLMHDTKFNVASSTINCHRDFADDIGLCLVNYTTTGGLNSYAVVENQDGPLYLISSSGNTLLFQSGSDQFAWLDSAGSTDMLLTSGVLSVATWEGVVVKEAFGGTAQSTYTVGDMLYASATNTLSKLAGGGEGQVITMQSGIPTWASNAASNTFITGFTYDNANTFTITRNDLSAFTATINTMTGLTVNGTLSATTINATTVSATTVNAGDILSGGTNLSDIFVTSASVPNTFVTGYTYDNANTFTISRNQGQPDLTTSINTMTGLTVTSNVNIGGNVVVTGNTVTNGNSITTGSILSGGTDLLNIFALSGATGGVDTYTTGFTYDNANNITLSQNEGQVDKVVNISTMTGLTINGTMSATTVDAGDILSGGTNINTLFQAAGPVVDPNAIHDNVDAEISAIAAKTALADADIFLIEDSAASDAKKKTTMANLKTAIGTGTPGVAQSIHSFNLASTSAQAPTTGSVYGCKVIPTVNRDVTGMSYFVTSASAGRTVYVGIYSNGLTLLAEGSSNAGTLGITTVTLDSTVSLVANTEYYFAILEGSGAPNFASQATFSLAVLGRAAFVSGTPTGLPVTLAGGATNKSFYLNAF